MTTKPSRNDKEEAMFDTASQIYQVIAGPVLRTLKRKGFGPEDIMLIVQRAADEAVERFGDDPDLPEAK